MIVRLWLIGVLKINFALDKKVLNSVEQSSKNTLEEVKLAKRIASLRIDIERVIGRIREFDILTPHACINNKLFCSIDDNVVVVCVIITVQDPLIKTYFF